MAANPGLRTNRWGSPIITPGQTLQAPSLQGLGAEQLARLGHTGGQIIGRNSQGLNARAQWLAAQQTRAAAQQAAARQSQGMSPEEAHARYMASGSRSSSYQRALGEDYRTTWHQGAGANTRPSTATGSSPGHIERFAGHAWRGVNAAVNAAAEPVAVAADLLMAGAGRAYTGITGRPVDMPFISFMSQDVAGGATTAELLHAQNPVYGLMVTADQLQRAHEMEDVGALVEIGGAALGGMTGGRRAPSTSTNRMRIEAQEAIEGSANPSLISNGPSLDWSRISPRTGGNAAHHVRINHGSLSLTKPNQGVFYGNPISSIESAWAIAQQNRIQPITIGNRDYFIIPRPNSGFAGGMGGQLQNYDFVTIITESGTNRIVTGYPSGGTPPIPIGYNFFEK